MMESEEFYFEKWVVAKAHVKELEKELYELKRDQEIKIKKAISDVKVELGIITSERDEAIEEISKLKQQVQNVNESKQIPIHELIKKQSDDDTKAKLRWRIAALTTSNNILFDKIRKLENQILTK